MNKFNTLVFGYILLFSSLTYGFAQVSVVNRFKNINESSGLNGKIINACVEDQQGMMWIASENGLHQFDGASFRIFKHIPNDSSSISSNRVSALHIDRKGNLWLGTRDKGLCRYEKNGKGFVRYSATNPLKGLIHNTIYCIEQDTNGMIWVGTEAGISILNPETGKFLNVKDRPKEIDQLRSPIILDLLSDEQGRMWVATRMGGISLLKELDYDHLKFLNFYNERSKAPILGSNLIKAIYQDKAGFFWIASYTHGLSVIAPFEGIPKDVNELTILQFAGKVSHYDYPISRYINTISESRNGEIWLGAQGMLSVLPAQDVTRFRETVGEGKADLEIPFGRRIFSNQFEKYALVDNQITNIYPSSQNTMWITTDNGISVYTFPDPGIQAVNFSNQFQYFRGSEALPIDENRIILLGINPAIIDYNPRLKKINYPTSQDEVPDLVSEVRSHYRISEDRLWIGGYRGSKIVNLQNYQSQTLDYEAYNLFQPNVPLQFNCFLKDRKGRLWAATSAGLLLFDNDDLRKPFQLLLGVEGTNKFIDQNWIRKVVEDVDGHLWVGTSDGLFKIEFNQQDDYKTFHFPHRTDQELSIPDPFIIDLVAANQDRMIWIATNQGVGTFDIHQYQYKEVVPTAGELQSFVIDENHSEMWGITTDGVYKFDLRTQESRYFDIFEGVHANNLAKLVKNKDQLFVLGERGYTQINYREILPKSFKPKIVFPEIKVGNQSLIPESTDELPAFTLNPYQNYFTVYFSCINAKLIDNKYYSYRLLGFDEDWQTHHNRNFVSYSNLKGGDYILEVRFSNDGINWYNEVGQLSIKVILPFYQQLWFRVGLLVLLVTTGILIYSRRLNKSKENEERLKQLVKKRTLALEQQQLALDKKNKELEQYIQSNLQLENFAYLASHDLKSPLQNVLNFSTLLRDRLEFKEDAPEKQFLNFIIDGADRMKNTVEDLLNFSLVTNNKINFEMVDLNQIVYDLLTDLQTVIQGKGAQIKMINIPNQVIADKGLLRELLLNLLTNAMKFVPQERPPVIQIFGETRKDQILISVKDNGIGIPEKHFEKIFGIFKRLHTRKEFDGTGIGLALCKKIIERHGGRISVENNVQEEGATFTFALPINPTSKKEFTFSAKKMTTLDEK